MEPWPKPLARGSNRDLCVYVIESLYKARLGGPEKVLNEQE